MPPLRPRVRLTRPRLLEPLSSPATVVAVIGPSGSGASTLLQEWCETRDDVIIVRDSGLPAIGDPGLDGSTLLVDDAERLGAADWLELARRIEHHPTMRVRLATHSIAALPRDWDIELVRDLAFTPEELTQYVALHGARVDPRVVFLATAGHVRSVRLIVESGVLRPDRFPAVLATGAAPLTPDQAALVVPGGLTPEIVDAFHGPAGFIEHAEAAGLGGWTTGRATEPVFALTPLVRAATAAEHPLPIATRRALRSHAADVLLREQAWLEAVTEGVEAGRLDVVDAALKGAGMSLLWEHGRELVWALQAIPALHLRRWPVIAIVQALILNARRQHAVRAVELMGVALIGVQRSPRDSPDRALLRTIESVARRLTGFGDGGVKAARSAIRMLDEMPPEQAAGIAALAGDLHVHTGISLLYAGLLDEARQRFERAAAAPSRPGVELQAFGGAALIEALQGDIAAAREWTARAAARAYPPELLDEYVGSMLRVAQAAIALEEGELDHAETALDSIWPIIDTIEHWPILAYVRSLVDLRRGTPDDGLERLRALRSRRGSRLAAASPTARMLDLAASTLALAAGDLASARALVPLAGDQPWVRLGAARVAVFEGDTDRALALLGSTQPHTPADRLTHLLLEAVLLRRLDRRDDASTIARRAGALGRAAGLTTPFTLLPADDRDLLDGEAPDDSLPGLTPVAPAPRLTARERVVLHELAGTTSVDEIAARLHVSVNTVKSQRRSLYRKLDVSSREDALAQAMAHGLLADVSAPTRAMNGTDTSATIDASPNSTP